MHKNMPNVNELLVRGEESIGRIRLRPALNCLKETNSKARDKEHFQDFITNANSASHLNQSRVAKAVNNKYAVHLHKHFI